MKFIFSLIFLFSGFFVEAQKTVDVDKEAPTITNIGFAVNGEPFSSVKYIKVVEGTPYFSESWRKATVIINDSAVARNQSIRIDLLESQVHYLDKNGEEMIVTQPLKKIIFHSIAGEPEIVFVNGALLPTTNKKFRKSWFQVAAVDQKPLYKYFKKVVNESKPYGSATFEQRIETFEQLYFEESGQLVPLKK